MIDDQEKGLRFYTDVLGFAKKADIPMGTLRWLTVTSPEGDEGVELVSRMNFPPAKVYQKALFDAGIPATAFLTSDIHSKFARLTSKGGHVPRRACQYGVDYRCGVRRHLRELIQSRAT